MTFPLLRGAASVAACALTLPLMLAAAPTHAQAYHLTFDDEFNSLSIANEDTYGDVGPKKPGRFEAWYRSHPPRHLITGEQEEFVDPAFAGFPNEAPSALGLDPFALHDGVVSLVGNLAPAEDLPYLDGQKFTSGMLTTYSSFSQKCGYFECRAKLPAGPGMWPAFWMLPTTLRQGSGDLNWQYEIDVFECFGAVTPAGGGPNQVHWALHVGNVGAGDWATVPGDIWTGYHTYGVNWQPYPGNITYYVDGQEIGSTPTNKNMDTPMFMIACLTMGGSWPGMVDPASGEFPAKMDIDYMRAYSSDPDSPAAVPQPGYAASTTTPILIADRAEPRISLSGPHTAAWRSWSVGGNAKLASHAGGDASLISDVRIVGRAQVRAASGFDVRVSRSGSSGVMLSSAGAGFDLRVSSGDAPRALRLIVASRGAHAALHVVDSRGNAVATDRPSAHSGALAYTVSMPAGVAYDISWTLSSSGGDVALIAADLENQTNTTGLSRGGYAIRPNSGAEGSLAAQHGTVAIGAGSDSWTITPVSGHLFKIRSTLEADEYLTYSPGRVNGLALRPGASDAAQLWQIEVNRDSSFTIAPSANPCEMLTCARSTAGTEVRIQRPQKGTGVTEWRLVAAPVSAH